MAATGPRPPSRPWHAVTRLDHLAIVSYAVDPDRLGRLLPDGLEPDLLPLDGEPTAVVSAVAGRNHRFRFRGAPFVTLSGGQIDYRAYVTAGGERGVWFFGAALDSPLAVVAVRLWHLPWHRATIALEGSWSGGELCHLRLDAHAPGAAARLVLHPGDPSPDPLAGCAAVTDPLVGWYAARGDGRRLRRYRVWHPPLEPVPATVGQASFEVFTALGLVDPDAPPRSALVQRGLELDVQTPPRRYRTPGAVGGRAADASGSATRAR